MPPGIRRRLEDQNAAAIVNARRFRRSPNTPPPGWSPDRGPAMDNTAGRRRWSPNQGPAMNNTAGRMRWNPHPEMRESNSLSSGIMNTLKNLYGKARSGLGKMTQPGYFGGAAAATVDPMDPNVYQKGKYWGSMLTPSGEDVNKAVGDWQDWRSGRIGSAYSSDDAQHIYNENYLGDFEAKYPGAAGLGMTPEDVYEQEELYKKAPPGYNFPVFGEMAGGGAVGLEPGIGSLMGYAKGGMVTKVKVPKGQGKWMKKFMNNMRDS